jgi:hypothetical protein
MSRKSSRRVKSAKQSKKNKGRKSVSKRKSKSKSKSSKVMKGGEVGKTPDDFEQYTVDYNNSFIDLHVNHAKRLISLMFQPVNIIVENQKDIIIPSRDSSNLVLLNHHHTMITDGLHISPETIIHTKEAIKELIRENEEDITFFIKKCNFERGAFLVVSSCGGSRQSNKPEAKLEDESTKKRQASAIKALVTILR